MTSATPTPRARSESSAAATAWLNGCRDVRDDVAAEQGARLVAHRVRCVLLAKESMATSAATPSEIDDM